MANNYKDIVLFGFDNIQIKQDNNWENLLGAINVNINISVGEVLVAKNPTFSQSFTNGNIEANGQLTLLELSLENRAKLFGHSISEKDGMKELIVRPTDTAPNFGLRFSKTKANGKKIIYQFDSVKFSEPSINADTIKNGQIEENNITIDFIIDNNSGVLYRIFENM